MLRPMLTSLRMTASRNTIKMTKLVLAVGLLSMIGLGMGARAAIVDLGTFSSAVSLPFESRLPPGPFEDTYTFTIEPGSTLLYSAFMSTGFMRNTGIPDMEASLFEAAALVETGVATTRFLPLVPFPVRDVEFAPILLDAGDYSLVVRGTAFATFPDAGLMAFYSGTLTLDTIPVPIPEPGSLLMLGVGLAALAIFRRRQGEPRGSATAMSCTRIVP